MFLGRKSPRRLYRHNTMPTSGLTFNENLLREARDLKRSQTNSEGNCWPNSKNPPIFKKELEVIIESGRSSLNTQDSPGYREIDILKTHTPENLKADKENEVEFDMSAARGFCLKCKKQVTIITTEKKKGWRAYCCLASSDKNRTAKICSRCMSDINQTNA
ncbi:unnamed protein product [Blepharisma stoltei]|uniref:GIY-YIG homing endonuclease n=1 Tax=Blepharisma stoltei TaxID=1481888 RepID=A0AAU9J8W6_9CILI|nr:unnamed protein product [Blepharisma stoltei]